MEYNNKGNITAKESADMEDKSNIFVIGVDMENRTVEEIAKDAAFQIVTLFDKLIEEQNAEVKNKKMIPDCVWNGD